MTFLMAGGGTGGHVIPLLAVARELRARGHEPYFIGTDRGLEAKLVPAEGFPLERIEIGGLKRVGLRQTLATCWQLPVSTLRSIRLLKTHRTAAVFSMGGYVAGPPVMAALVKRLPVVVMEPQAIPGFTNRKIARFVTRALVSFPQTMAYFPEGKSEVTGLPLRDEFFRIPSKPRGATLTVLISGGSQGSRTLNQAARQSWPRFRESRLPVRFLLQTGRHQHEELSAGFAATGLAGEVTPFIADMPAAFAQADLIVCRAGAGTISEVAAAGKPSVLVPFPFAADDHQRHNAEAFARAGAARVVTDQEMTGERLFSVIAELAGAEGELERMGTAARQFARPGAAQRAAEILIDSAKRVRNNND